jgi:hypothetical protein
MKTFRITSTVQEDITDRLEDIIENSKDPSLIDAISDILHLFESPEKDTDIILISKRLQLDDFATQLLMHYTQLPIETLRRRLLRATSDEPKLLIETAITFKEKEDLTQKVSDDDIPHHIRERVLYSIGEASMCWENPGGCGIFDTTDAVRIGLELCQFIIDQIAESTDTTIDQNDKMNLYKIVFSHSAPRDIKYGLKGYVLARNDEDVYGHIIDENYTNWIEYEEDPAIILEDDSELQETFHEKIIRLRGDIHDEDHYGVSYYGWELVAENCNPRDFSKSIELGIIKLIKEKTNGR